MNSQLKSLVRDADFKEAAPMLFGDNFVRLAKKRSEAAAALKLSTDKQQDRAMGVAPTTTVANTTNKQGQQQQICQVKEMTINSQLCAPFNTCGKSFIKSCDQYSVTGITSTSYTGSHKQQAPVNKMPKSGWAGVTLPNKWRC